MLIRETNFRMASYDISSPSQPATSNLPLRIQHLLSVNAKFAFLTGNLPDIHNMTLMLSNQHQKSVPVYALQCQKL